MRSTCPEGTSGPRRWSATSTAGWAAPSGGRAPGCPEEVRTRCRLSASHGSG
jgi:hypothetical protein